MGSFAPTGFRPALVLAAALPMALGLALPAVAAGSQPGGTATAAARRAAMRPRLARRKPAPFFDGCMVGVRGTRSGRCLYGDPRGRRTLFLFGDSHALQHFPALQVTARRRRWRLVVLTKTDCTPARARVRNEKGGGEYRRCDAWRRNVLRRIEGAGPTAIVAMSGYAAYRVYGPGGTLLGGAANAAAMEAGYLATLRRLRRAGPVPVVIRDTPEAPFNVPRCVAARTGRPAACAFRVSRERNRDFDVRAARRSEGTGLVDLVPAICPRGRCRAVIRDILVYRDRVHLNAPYARTLSRRFEPALGRAARRASRERPPTGS